MSKIGNMLIKKCMINLSKRFRIEKHAMRINNNKKKLANKNEIWNYFLPIFQNLILKYKFEGNLFFKFSKSAKKCNFYFSKN